MGAFVISYHVKTDDHEAVRAALSRQLERCWLGPCDHGWVSFYEPYGPAGFGEIPETLSRELGCPLIRFDVHDSDFLCYVLCDAGRERDVYNSDPGCYDGVDGPSTPQAEKDRLRGRTDVLLEYAPAGTNRDALDKLLHHRAQEFAFAEQHLEEFAKALGINPKRARTTYDDVGVEFEPEEMQLEFAGSGEPDSDEQSRWPVRIISMEEDADKVLAEESPQAYVDVARLLNQLPTGQRLAMAVAYEEISEVRRLLDQGIDSAHCGNALIIAVRKGHQELLDVLLNHVTDLTFTEEDTGMTVLHYAACNGDASLVQRLVGLGCHVNAIDNVGGYTPLHRAIEAAAPHVVEVLLDTHADPSVKDEKGKDALRFAEDELQLNLDAKLRWEAEGRRYPKESDLPNLERCIELLRAATR